MNGLAAMMKVNQRGALAVYLADRDQWLIRIAPDSAADFIAGPRASDGTKPAVLSGKTLDQARDEFLATAREQADRFIANAAKAAPGQVLGPPQKLKLHVDAILDGLIFRLEPNASELDGSTPAVEKK